MSKTGPGKAHRSGITLPELFDLFPDEEAARLWIESIIWPFGPVCPRCGAQDRVNPTPNGKPMPYWCGDCRRHFSVRLNTVFERSKVPLRKWAIAIYLEMTSLKGISSMKLHRDLGVTQRTAWFMLHRIREVWADGPAEQFQGPVEADESYFGGKMKNRPVSKRVVKGRGMAGKIPVVAVLDRSTKQVSAIVPEDTRRPVVHAFIRSEVEPGAALFTDEAKVYQGLTDFEHEAVKHSVFEYVRGQIHTNHLESFWSMLKRAYHGTFHKISRKHLQRYVDEFAARYGMRDQDTLSQMEQTARGAVGRRITYKELTR